MSERDYIEEFLEEHQGHNTYRNYKADLLAFFGGKEPTLEELQAVTPSQLLQWRKKARYSLNWKGSTVNRRLTTVTKFFEYITNAGYIKSNPTQVRGLKRLKVSAWSPKLGLEQEHTLLILAACVPAGDPKTERQALVEEALAARDKAIIALAVTSLLRRTEIADIEHEDISYDGNKTILTIREAKGGENERVLIIPEAMEYINQYLKALEPLKSSLPPVSARNPLFIGLGNRNFGKKLTDWSIYHMVVKRAEEAGIKFHVSPHTMRHTGITQMLENGVPLHEVQIAARHKDPKTTMLYYRNLRALKQSPTQGLDRMISKKKS